MRPKTVTPRQQPQYFPDDAQGPSEFLQPIWGNTVRQLLDGGPWDPKKPPEGFPVENGIPRRPMQVEIYEENVVEPDPAISSFTTTWELVRAMWRAGWSREQVEVGLANPVHAGGDYYRWKLLYDKDPDALLDQIWSEVAASEANPYYAKQVEGGSEERLGELWPVAVDPAVEALLSDALPCNRSFPPEIPITRKEGKKRFPVDEREATKLWRWLLKHPELSQNQITQQGPLSSRDTRNYLHHLEAQRRATAAEGTTIVTAAGKRTAKVWKAVRIEPEPPQTLPLTEIYTLLNWPEP